MTKKKSLSFIIFIILFVILAQLAARSDFSDKLNNTPQDLKDVKIISGDFGELKVIKNDEEKVYRRVITLNDEVILHNDHVGFELAYPNLKKPELVIAWADCGGSACGRAHATFIDLKSTPVFHEEVPELLASNIKITKRNDGFLLDGTSSFLENDYGDLVPLKLEYSREKKLLRFVPKEGAYDYSAFAGLHPHQLLGDESARQIFLRKMSPEQFKHFRHSISVGSVVSTDNHARIYEGSGIAPHSGGNPSAFFIIDAVRDKFLAGIYSDGQVQIITDLNVEHLDYSTVSILNEYLKEYKMRWDYDLNKAVPDLP